MSIAELRTSLIHYIEDADDTKIQALYNILEPEEYPKSHGLTTEQKQIVAERRRAHVSGETKSYTWEEVKASILNK